MIDSSQEREHGAGLGWSIIGALCALVVVALAFKGSPIGNVFFGLGFMACGATFICSFYLSHKTFLFRWIIWLCENVSLPSGAGMALVYGALASAIGAAITGHGIGFW